MHWTEPTSPAVHLPPMLRQLETAKVASLKTVWQGAPSLALEHYRALNLKQIQTDTLSHLTLSRSSTFALASLGDMTYSSECMEASQIYLSNANEVTFAIRTRPSISLRVSLDRGVHRTGIPARKVLSGECSLKPTMKRLLSNACRYPSFPPSKTV